LALPFFSSADVSNIKWDSATAFRISEGVGSSGVFFIDVGSQTFVLKAPPTPVQECFATLFACILGVNAPRISILQKEDKDWILVTTQLEKLMTANRDPYLLHNNFEWIKYQRLRDRPFLLIMEYVRGNSLASLSFSSEKLFSEKEGKKRLYDIGQLISIDVICNNWDRVPIIWPNNGNFENILIETIDTSTPGKIVGVDFGLTCIKQVIYNQNNLQYTQYLEKLQILIDELNQLSPSPISSRDSSPSSSPITLYPLMADSPSSPLNKVKESFLLYCGYELTKVDMIYLEMGILNIFLRFCKLSLCHLQSLKKFIENTIHTSRKIWFEGLESIRLEFLESIYNLLLKNQQQMENIFSLLQKVVQ